jgi:hypothetical protein
MEDSRYLQCLAADCGDLRDAASAAELTANVPSCPGWTVADLVRHVAPDARRGHPIGNQPGLGCVEGT